MVKSILHVSIQSIHSYCVHKVIILEQDLEQVP